MPVISAERFATGMTWAEYLAGDTRHKEQRQKGYEAVTFTPEQEKVLQLVRELNLKVLVIEEHWCGDAARSGPVLARLAETAGMEARWFLRDQNPDLIDQYLENGKSRAIPVMVFMDSQGQFLARWGSRPAAVRAAKATLGPLPSREDPAFEQTFAKYVSVLTEAYEQNYPSAIVEELLDTLMTGLANN